MTFQAAQGGCRRHFLLTKTLFICGLATHLIEFLLQIPREGVFSSKRSQLNGMRKPGTHRKNLVTSERGGKYKSICD